MFAHICGCDLHIWELAKGSICLVYDMRYLSEWHIAWESSLSDSHGLMLVYMRDELEYGVKQTIH